MKKTKKKSSYIVRIVIAGILLAADIAFCLFSGILTSVSSQMPTMPQPGSFSSQDSSSENVTEGFSFDPSTMPSMSGSSSEDGTASFPSMPSMSGSSSEDGAASFPSMPSMSGSSSGDGTDSFPSMPQGMTPSGSSSTSSLTRLLYQYRFICLGAAGLIGLICLILIITGIVGLIRIKNAPADSDQDTTVHERVDPAIARKKKQRNQRIQLIGVVALMLVVILVLQTLSSDVKSDASGSSVEEKLISSTVDTGTISKTISSYGTLASATEEDVTIPGSIKIEEYHVKNGDLVKEGDIIATVERNSVLAAIADIEELLEKIDEEISDEKDEKISTYITAPTAGTIVKIYAQKDDSVTDVMYENSALMILSVDGLLAVKIENNGSLQVGNTVSVLNNAGSSFTGTVTDIEKDTVTITLPLGELSLGESISVIHADGTVLGNGELYVYNQIKITGYTGTINSILTSEGKTVKSGAKLIKLSDTEDTANYQVLLGKRDTLVKQYYELVSLSRSGYLYASHEGVISGLDESLLETSSTTSSGGAAGSPSTTVYSIIPVQAITRFSSGSATILLEEGDSPEPGSVKISKTINVVFLSPTGSVMDFGTPSELTFVLYANGTEVARKTISRETDWSATFSNLDKNDASGAINYRIDLAEPLDGYTATTRSSGNTMTIILQQSEGGGGGGGGFRPGGGGGFSFGGTSTTTTTVEETYVFDETTVCTLVTNDTVNIDVSIDELDISSIVVGSTVQVTLDALPGQVFEGTIEEIDPFGEDNSDGGNTKYTVTVSMDKNENMLLGMNATVIINLGDTPNVLLLNEAAIYEEKGRTYVYTAYDEKTDTLSGKKEVTLGIADGTNAQVLSGLSEGDTYYYRYSGTIQYTFTTANAGTATK